MLVNKRLTAGNINLLRLMFPNYDLINETNIPENPVRPAIYSGDTIKVDEKQHKEFMKYDGCQNTLKIIEENNI